MIWHSLNKTKSRDDKCVLVSNYKLLASKTATIKSPKKAKITNLTEAKTSQSWLFIFLFSSEEKKCNKSP